MFRASHPDQVRRACFRAGLADVGVAEVGRVFTELLDQPRRAR